MPETEFKDLAEKPAETAIAPEGKAPKPYYHTLPLSIKQLDELEDYDLGDMVHLEIVCEITRVSKEEDKPKEVTLTMRKGRVLNLTDARQKAIERGISKKTSDEIEAKRKKEPEAE